MSSAVGDAVEDCHNSREQCDPAQEDVETDHGRVLPWSATLATTNVIQIASPTTGTGVENGCSATFRCFASNSIIVVLERTRGIA
jgi:hypothetical protein